MEPVSAVLAAGLRDGVFLDLRGLRGLFPARLDGGVQRRKVRLARDLRVDERADTRILRTSSEHHQDTVVEP